eukprot:gnl/MRDRNA2_/MRDRNA2_266806_c0_seq1.p1 gnl/MRDRNA2_/MRDRNA2_266806_c0~~gnl/MRDRNA2_/MRDRNA2_266806_c0_seq1.p1  ORF type:complete len:344 (-),score=59.48 gnl/MRDRNA2_/MRDRNA2_266806_c0_seq1:8-994(-)
MTAQKIAVEEERHKQPSLTLTGLGNPVHVVLLAGDLLLASLEGEQLCAEPDRAPRICVWSISRQERVEILLGHTHVIRAMAHQGNTIVTGGNDHMVFVWNFFPPDDPGCPEESRHQGRAHAEKIHMFQGHTGAVLALVLQGDWVVSGSNDERVIVWSLAKKEQLFVLKVPDMVCCVQFVRSNLVAVGLTGAPSTQDVLNIWKLDTQDVAKRLVGHEGAVSALAVAGDILASGSNDETVILWSCMTLELRAVLKDHRSPVSMLAFARGDELLLSSTCAGEIFCWSVHSHEPVAMLVGHEEGARVKGLAAEGALVASGGDDETLQIWRLV